MHSVLLPANYRFANLSIDPLPQTLHHTEPQRLPSLLRNRFWIIAGRGTVGSRVHRCATCLGINPVMGDLPQSRFTQGRAFLNVGVDFAGPFFIKESQRRKAELDKAYICLFICFSTKAVHIEVVSQLSTDAFMACFDRFVARRGLTRKVFSDNATNFVGASNRLRELYKWWTSTEIIDKLKGYFIIKGVEWHFIPPLAPQFGGLWKAGIKSYKYHLVRIVGNLQTSFKELATIVTRIKAVLNSRSLYMCALKVRCVSSLMPR
ncbi:uncharacterized protein [Halyomorpha halys]|uniref:uncharacterized protein n=1 Tax=Halyomorpha halys TaxID=286706 RepID=UPI0006D528EC